MPAGLSGVVAIAAGGWGSLALKRDGTVVAWGTNSYGETSVPAGLSGVVAVAADDDFTLVIVAAPSQRPSILDSPQSQIVQTGNNVTFTVMAVGTPAPNYQWQFNGYSLSGATGSALTLNSVTAGNSGGYSVVVSNPYGSATSATASLAVLGDGANGNTPVQISVPAAPPQPTGVDSLVVVTHGFIFATDPPVLPSWVTTLANDIQAHSPANWSAVSFDWSEDAWGINPEDALVIGNIKGLLYGQQLSQQHWKYVHLIAHSAGAALIQGIADQLKSSPNPPTIQMTFLDPFVGVLHEWQNAYGGDTDWADCYSVEDGTGGFTSGNLDNAFNVDVSWVDPTHTSAPYIGLGGGEVALSSHGYPIDFYTQSILNTDPNWCASSYGFALSQEAEGVFWLNNQANDPIGNSPVLPCSPADAVYNPNPGIAGLEAGIAGIPTDLSDAAHATSGAAATLVGDAGFELQSIWSSLPLVKSGGVHPLGRPVPQGGGDNTNAPAWFAVGVTVTNAVNFVQFGAAFTDTNAAQGLLTVYWNTNEIGMVDERVAETNLQTYRFELPDTVTGGDYTLSFRLDSFDNSSSIAVTNVATGFGGVTQPITLGISLTNGAPLLQLTGATNFVYLVQSSTNLVDWSPSALVVNTNGTVIFADPMATNFGARFYRAVMP